MLTSYRGLPTRFVWGDTYANNTDLASPLDEALAYDLPRDGSQWVRNGAGVETAWRIGRDYFLKAKARRIPFDGTAIGPLIGRRHSGWDDADGWRAMLEWARAKNVLRFYPDARNLLAAPSLGVDSNADGVVDGWTWQPGGVAVAAFDAINLAQKITANAGGNPGATVWANINQRVYGILPGETISLSAELQCTGLANGAQALVSIQWRDANGVDFYAHQDSVWTDTVFTRRGKTAVAPAGTAGLTAALILKVPTNTGTISAGSVLFRNVVLERAVVASPAFIANPGYRSVYLVEPITDLPEHEKDFSYRVPLLLRAADRSAFVGY